MKAATILPLAAASLLLATPVLFAGQPDFTTPVVPAPESDGWEFTIVPYGFFAAIDADVEVGPLDADLEIDFGDLLENLDMFAMIGAEARYNRFSVQGDLLYMGVSGDTSLNRPLYSRAKLELDLASFTALGMYRVWDSAQGYLEVGGGARLFWAQSRIRFSGAAPARTAESEHTIWDGIGAARFVYNIDQKWSVRVYGDIGGGDSDLTWQVWGKIGYALTDNTILHAGYRYLSYDFSGGRTSLDLTFSGPQVGVAISF